MFGNGYAILSRTLQWCNNFYMEGLQLTRVNKRAPGSKSVSELVDVFIGVRQVDVNNNQDI